MDAPAPPISHRVVLDNHMLEVRGKAAEDELSWGKKFVEIWVRSPSHPSLQRSPTDPIYLSKNNGGLDINDETDESFRHLLQARWIFKKHSNPDVFSWAGKILLPQYEETPAPPGKKNPPIAASTYPTPNNLLPPR